MGNYKKIYWNLKMLRKIPKNGKLKKIEKENFKNISLREIKKINRKILWKLPLREEFWENFSTKKKL